MARIRTIKPEAHLDEDLWDAEQETGLPLFRAFTGLWCQADKEGRFEWRPRQLKAAILPYWEGDFSRVLDAFVTHGFVRKYVTCGREYGVIPTFRKHQFINGKEPESQLPVPPENAGESIASRVNDTSSTREAREENAPIPSLPIPDPVPEGVQGEGVQSVGNRPPPKDPFGDTLRKSPPGKRADVLRVWDAFKLALDYPPKTKFRGDWDQDAVRIADAIDAHDLETCLAVVAQAPRDGMVNGSADERGQKHDTIPYIFENQNTFNRLLREAEKASKAKPLSAAEATRQARMA